MPCTMGMDSSGYDHTARQENERLTRVSCDIMRVLEANGFDLSAFGHETREWWDRHKASDAAQAAAAQAQARRDELRQEALAKLTPDERKALGI